MKALKETVDKKNALDRLRPLKREDEMRIMQKFRLDWNYHSNAIEGNTLTYGETRALLLHNITANGKPLKDHFEIKGHNEAVEWVLEVVKGDRPLNQTFIRELHKLILKESYESAAITPEGLPTKKKIKIGEYKQSPNHVKTRTGEIFRFATPAETPALMADLISWYENEIKEEPSNPILLAAHFHYKFIRIHPFDDGNGRTVRILMNFILMKYGYPPVIIENQDKAAYYRVLEQADANIIEPFIEFIAENLNRSLDLMIKGAKGESISELTDIDKEIALIDDQLKADSDPIIITKSQEAKQLALDSWINQFLTDLLIQLGKFDKYYRETEGQLGNVKVANVKKEFFINNFIKILSLRDLFEIQYKYIGFSKNGLSHYNYFDCITIEFKEDLIFVSGKFSDKKLSVLYGESPSRNDIEEFILSIVKPHAEHIKKIILDS